MARGRKKMTFGRTKGRKASRSGIVSPVSYPPIAAGKRGSGRR